MRDELKQRCDRIEEAYEFSLAYAAQGLAADPGGASSQVRMFLTNAAAALTGLADLLRRLATTEGLSPADAYTRFATVVERDADAALAAVQLVLAQTAISSQLVDNLNASIHLRALLTDLFLIDEILKLQSVPSPSRSSD